MLSLLAIASVMVAPSGSLNILFVGNSHTAIHYLPGMVASILESDGSKRKVTTKLHPTGFLEDLATSAVLDRDLKSKQWDVIVLQGAKLSSSQKIEYDHSGAVAIAKNAMMHGVTPYLFAEWPRKGWKESDYIMREYREISSPSGAAIIPICFAWEAFMLQSPKAELWGPDGNHSTAVGTFLAASTIARWLASSPDFASTWKPAGISSKLASQVAQTATSTVRRYKKPTTR